MPFSFKMNRPPEIVMLGTTVCSSNWKLHPRTISDYEIIICFRGEVVFTIDDRPNRLLPGDFLLIPPGEIHSGTTSVANPGSFYYTHFLPPEGVQPLSEETVFAEVMQTMNEISAQLESRSFFILPGSTYDKVCIPETISLGQYRDEVFTLFEKALHERNLLTVSSKSMIALYLNQVLILVTRLVLDKIKENTVLSREGETPRILQQSIFQMQERNDAPIDIAHLCRRLDISPQYLCRLFQKHMHISPVKYMNRWKISRAKELMRNTSLTMKEIAFATGFENAYYFSRMFRKLEGMTPTEYKVKLDTRSNM